MKKKIALYNSNIEETIKNNFANCEITIIKKIKELSGFDIVILNDYNGELPPKPSNTTVLNIHPSLLPAFEGENAIEKALKFGAKVSGITIHSGNKILAQYPVLIGIETHIDDFMAEMLAVEKKLVPAVIDAILNDRVFDFADLFSTQCSKAGGCSGCGGCH